jgi:hypothetical protein
VVRANFSGSHLNLSTPAWRRPRRTCPWPSPTPTSSSRSRIRRAIQLSTTGTLKRSTKISTTICRTSHFRMIKVIMANRSCPTVVTMQVGHELHRRVGIDSKTVGFILTRSQLLYMQIITTVVWSISSTFFTRNFCTKFWRQKYTAFVQNFGAKNALLYEKRARKTLMKLTPNHLDQWLLTFYAWRTP